MVSKYKSEIQNIILKFQDFLHSNKITKKLNSNKLRFDA